MLLLFLLAGSRASADTASDADTVILLQPASASPAVRRSLARIGEELSADHFHVVLAEADDPGRTPANVESAVGPTETGTAVVLFGDAEVGPAEICVVRRTGQRIAVRWATVAVPDRERMPEALARRALELLRATALELSIGVGPAAPPETLEPRKADLSGPVDAPVAPPATVNVTIDVGLATWTSFGGPPPAVTPVGRIALWLSNQVWARITAAGLGTRPSLETRYGSATVSQALALGEAVAVFRGDKQLRPFVSLGAGAVEVAVSGTGTGAYEGRAPQRWSAAFDGGLGVAFLLNARAALVAELHGLVAAPHPVVRFADTRAATIGYPSVVLTAALQVAP
jgi:hypothetical protein